MASTSLGVPEENYPTGNISDSHKRKKQRLSTLFFGYSKRMNLISILEAMAYLDWQSR